MTMLETILSVTVGLLILFTPYFATAVGIWIGDKTAFFFFGEGRFEVAASESATVILLATWSFIFVGEMVYYFYFVGSSVLEAILF